MLKNLHMSLFLVPVVVLLLNFVLFRHLQRGTEEKSTFRRLMIRIALLAFVLNLIWELAHGPLYEGYVYDFQHISFCTLASVADMLMALLLYMGFAFFLKDPFWIRRPSVTRILSLMLVGATGAILAEMRHTWEGNWAYADSMPLLPLVLVGLSPVMQFTLLPVVIYGLSARSTQTNPESKKL